MANRNRSQLCRLSKLVVLGFGAFLPACNTPPWCATRAFRCLPPPADTSAPSYWQECERQTAADARTAGADSKTPSKSDAKNSSKSDEEEDKNQRDEKRDNEVPDPKSETQAPRAFAAPPIQLVSMQRPVAIARQDGDEKSTDDESPSDREKADRKKADRKKADEAEAERKKAQDAQDKQPNPFQLPSILPGADTPPLSVPRQANDAKGKEKDAAEKEREAAFAKLYPVLIPQPQIAAASPDAALGVMGLEELQQFTRDNHPGVRAAAAAVETARGLMIQAGLPPNPSIGYEADTVRTAFTNGYHGAYIQQTFITARKLGLAAEAAAVDHANASLNMQKVWYSAISEVRRQYFNTLSARQRLQLAEGLLTLSDRSYQTQIELVKAGEAAAYEPLQLRVLTTQARATVVQAQQDSLAAWRSLAAAIGMPSLPASALAGRIDCKVPEVDYEAAVSRMIAVHTDLQIARNLVGKNRTLVTLADRTPIPDVNVGVVVQHDYTFNPGTTTYNLLLGGAIPVFDRNQGNRVATRADLVKSTHTVNDTQNQLIGQLAPVFSKYQANRQLASSFRTDALADQVQAYRGIYQRYHTDPTGIGFNDIIVAQQTLAATLTQYLSILQSQWQGTVDVGELLQVDDLFLLGPLVDVAQIPVIVDTPVQEVVLAEGQAN